MEKQGWDQGLMQVNGENTENLASYNQGFDYVDRNKLWKIL